MKGESKKVPLPSFKDRKGTFSIVFCVLSSRKFHKMKKSAHFLWADFKLLKDKNDNFYQILSFIFQEAFVLCLI